MMDDLNDLTTQQIWGVCRVHLEDAIKHLETCQKNLKKALKNLDESREMK